MNDNTDLIAEARRNAPESVDESLIMRLAVALEEAEPRVITQLGDLESLPDGTVIQDSDPEICERRFGRWYAVGLTVAFSDCDISLPATVLHEPNAEATR